MSIKIIITFFLKIESKSLKTNKQKKAKAFLLWKLLVVRETWHNWELGIIKTAG